jgi:hypothetical protein
MKYRVQFYLTVRDLATLDGLNGVTRSDKLRRAIELAAAIQSQRAPERGEVEADCQAAD